MASLKRTCPNATCRELLFTSITKFMVNCVGKYIPVKNKNIWHVDLKSQFHRQGCSKRIWGLKLIWDWILPSECSEPPNHESLELTPVVFLCQKKIPGSPRPKKEWFLKWSMEKILYHQKGSLVLGLVEKSPSFISATPSRFMFDQSKSQIV